MHKERVTTHHTMIKSHNYLVNQREASFQFSCATEKMEERIVFKDQLNSGRTIKYSNELIEEQAPL